MERKKEDIVSAISIKNVRENKTFYICLIVIFLATFISFFPSLKNGFVNYDDDQLLTQNNKIKALTPENILNYFKTYHINLYHPLVLLSYSIEYKFFKLNPFIYHFTNLILHFLNTVILFYIILSLTCNLEVSFITSLLFGIHPVHVESVTWISERKDVLFTFFYLGSLFAYIKDKKYLSILLFVLSLLSKVMAVTLPVVLALIDYLKTGKVKLKDKYFYFLLSLIFGIVAILIVFKTGNIRKLETSVAGPDILLPFFSIVFYIFKILIPHKLVCLYPHPLKMELIMKVFYYISPLIIGLLAIFVYLSKKFTRKIMFGFLFFFFTISPIIQIIPVGKAPVADRNLYIPSIGLFYLVAEGFYYFKGKKPEIKIFLKILLFLSMVIFSVITFRQCDVWKDSKSLWTNVIKNYPDIAVAYLNRGNYLLEKKDYKSALLDYNMAISLDPKYVKAYNNRGNLYNEIKEYQLAINDYEKAIELDSSFVQAYLNMGNAYANLGKIDTAIKKYTEAIEIKQDYADAYSNRGVQFGKKGELDRAIEDFSRAIKYNPYFSDAYYNRGVAYKLKGNIEQADKDFIIAEQLSSKHRVK